MTPKYQRSKSTTPSKKGELVSNKLFILQQSTGNRHHENICFAAVYFLATILPVLPDSINLNIMTIL